MNILHVSNVDLPGRRFNGYDLLEALRPLGIAGKQAVLDKLSNNADVVSILDDPGDAELNSRIATVEQRHSLNNVLVPWGRVLAGSPEFEWADVVHYHLLHNQVISLLDLPRLMGLKPSVWTFHDAWALTGHCLHPMDCEGWLTGCASCPSLDALFPLAKDCADRMWRIKQRVYARLDVDIVVASGYMRDMVSRSPLTSSFERVHLIPFGIETAPFLPDSAKAESRKALRIAQEDFVLFFRATDSPLKGLDYIIEALSSAPPARPTTLLTVDQRGLIKRLSHDYRVIELGWVEDPGLYLKLFSACDVFLMPSIAEAFGLMALEAMAAGRPVICFEGTSLPSITHAPERGLSVPLRDSAALRAAIDRLCADRDEVTRRGQRGRAIARGEYHQATYLEALASVYRSVARTTAGAEIAR